MPAYVIFIRERTLDPSELEAYARAAPPSLAGWPIKFLAAYGRLCVKVACFEITSGYFGQYPGRHGGPGFCSRVATKLLFLLRNRAF
jgi:hypothetical protein